MKESILNGKRILAVDDEPDVLAVLEEEILGVYPDSKFDKATTYEEAVAKMISWTYDVVVLDIVGVRGLDLLELAASREFPSVMLTTYPLTPEALEPSFQTMAQAYLPKENLGAVVPFLEDVLRHEYLPGWRRLFEKAKVVFKNKFKLGWERRSDLAWQRQSKWSWQFSQVR